MSFAAQLISRSAALVIAFMLTGVSALAQGEPFPNRTMTLVVAFPPGGPPDLVARIVSPALSEILGKPIVIENRPGASASIAAVSVARSAPDGHTMLNADLSLAVARHVIANASFDPERDFRFVVLTARTPMTMVIGNHMGIASVADLVAAAKRNPDDIKAAHTGIATPPHLALLSFLQATGTSVLQVPYKGAAMAIQDIVAGHISLLCTGPSTSISLSQEGKVRMLGVTGKTRLGGLPDVPTFTESGVDMAGMNEGQFFGLSVPSGTPDAIVHTLNVATNKALLDPNVRDKLAKLAIEPVGGTSEAFATLFKAQATYWRGVLDHAGIKPM